MAAREVYLLIILRTDWSESTLPDWFTKKWLHDCISDRKTALYSSRAWITASVPIWIFLSFEPFPYIKILLSYKFTSFIFKEHNSEILMPVAKSSSITAMSLIEFFFWQSVLASERCVYMADRKCSTVWRGIVFGSVTGLRNFTCILLKGFRAMTSLYSR